MPRTSFDELLDAIDHLPIDEQADLVEVVRRRLAEQGRFRVVSEVNEARQEFAATNSKPVAVADLMREIES